MAYTVIIPNRYRDLAKLCLSSLRNFSRIPVRIIIVADGHRESYGCEMVPYPDKEKFCFAKAMNLGIKAAPETNDIVLMNDDVAILEMGTLDRLAEIPMNHQEIGIISPMIMGHVGCSVQRWHSAGLIWKPGDTLCYVHGMTPVCFPCVWISRKMISQIGLLDESFTGYGGEDVEYCLRARAAGWRTAVSREIVVQHGSGGPQLAEGRGITWSLSFSRRYPEPNPCWGRRQPSKP
jgi:hypothetical protein